MGKKLRLVPSTSVKFVQAQVGDQKVQIWRKFPGSKEDEIGTEVDYDLAIKLLALQPSIVTIVPKIENGKFVRQLEGEDANRIEEAQATGQSMAFPSFTPGVPNPVPVLKDDAATNKLIETQQKLIEELTKANKIQAERLDKLEATVSKSNVETSEVTADGVDSPEPEKEKQGFFKKGK